MDWTTKILLTAFGTEFNTQPSSRLMLIKTEIVPWALVSDTKKQNELLKASLSTVHLKHLVTNLKHSQSAVYSKK